MASYSSTCCDLQNLFYKKLFSFYAAKIMTEICFRQEEFLYTTILVGENK
jgi:hypothetical protein